jgi:hypothetical protein
MHATDKINKTINQKKKKKKNEMNGKQNAKK